MLSGLNDEEVNVSRSKNGSNIINGKKGHSFIKLLIESLGDPIIKILLIALAIKLIFLFKDFDYFETIGILIAIFLASFISSISEYGSNKAFERLQESSMIKNVKVYRNNKLFFIDSKDIVVDDIIKLESGDRVPADGYIIDGFLSLDESFMSGETKEIYKKCVFNSKKSKENAVYSGSTIYKGNAVIKVTEVGDKTFMGSISKEMQEKTPESPLKKRLRVLAKQISVLGYTGALLASISYLFMEIFVKNNFDWNAIYLVLTNYHLLLDYLIYALTLSVTIIIVAVPEGLPMMITLVLSSNMKKMLKDNILVRKLVGIETSGALNVLLCDKTGTLTEGNLKVKEICTKDNLVINNLNNISFLKEYNKVLIDSLYLNNDSSDENYVGGNITDKAIMKFLNGKNSKESILRKEAFDSEKKYSMVETNDYIYYKGASEVLLNKCSMYLDKDGKEQDLINDAYIKSQIDKYTNNGYRVLINIYENKDNKKGVFISLIVMSDTIRKEAKESLKTIKKAGIKTIMITGDAKKTAYSIAKDLDMIDEKSIVLTHDELNNLSDNEVSKLLPDLKVIARALPQDKSRLVSIIKNNNLVVGMTGDGVNDALALKKSDVGFALGSGCEVAKQASDIVILDDNINSICKAILYGRTIFKSIRKFIVYQLTVNVCALFLSIVGTLIGVTNPITIIQMLWLNMIMDTFAGLAFSYEPPLLEYMDEKPKTKNETIMNKYMFNQIVTNGLFSAILCILFLKVPYISLIFRTSANDQYLMTAYFALFIFLGIGNSFISRTHRLNIFANILKNKVFIIINVFIICVQIIIIYKGGDLFRTYGLTINEIMIVLMIAFTIFPVDFIRKKILKIKKVPLGV